MLSLIDRLPRHSHFWQDMLTDEVMMEQLLAAQSKAKDMGPSGPPLATWTPEAGLLADVLDRLGDVVSGLVALGGGRPSPVQRYDRPVTAYDGAYQKRRMARHEELVAAVLPPDRRN